MRRAVIIFSDELQLQIVLEYLNTNISQKELLEKYNFGGKQNIDNWMRKFGPSNTQKSRTPIHRTMSTTPQKSEAEEALESMVTQLEAELEQELSYYKLSSMPDIQKWG